MRNIVSISLALAIFPAAAQTARLHVQVELVSGVKARKAKAEFSRYAELNGTHSTRDTPER